MQNAVSKQAGVRLELVDSNGVLPTGVPDKVFLRAYDFRRFLHKHLLPHLAEPPSANPLLGVNLPRLPDLPNEIHGRWPEIGQGHRIGTAELPIDHSVTPVESRGGSRTARKTLQQFLVHKLSRYADNRNRPDHDATSNLSPYLHFGHISAHEVFSELTRQADWTPGRVDHDALGKAAEWWGLTEHAGGFLDQLITWRELGFNCCSKRGDFDSYESLPQWAQKTLEEHADDERPHCYSTEQFEQAETHSQLWNASQRQLVREGRIHNYLRMLWGKKILEWSESPQDALRIMLDLNNKYAVDGRDPNSYSGIFWVLGRYDRPWGPERPIFGRIRYMSIRNTMRKLSVASYMEKYAAI